MPALPRTLALVVLLASLAAAGPVAAGPPHETTAPDPPTPGDSTASAIPAPLCGVPANAGVLALVPPPTASADDGSDSPDEDGSADSAATNATPDPAVGTTRTAVVDRFEGDTAVLLVEARGDVVARRLVRRRALPRAARHQDAVVTVTVLADSVAAIEYQPVETVRRSQEARQRFERLSGAGSGGGPAVC